MKKAHIFLSLAVIGSASVFSAVCADVDSASKTAPVPPASSHPAPAPPAASDAIYRQMAEKIREAHILDPRTFIIFNKRADGVAVSCSRNPNATEVDQKINAMLIGKVVFDLAPEFKSINVNFSVHATHEVWTVFVKKNLVLDFKNGDISQKAALNSLTVNKHLIFSEPVDGHDQADRKLIYDILCELESKQVPNTLLVDVYRFVEDSINNKESAASVDLKFAALKNLTTAAVRAYNVEQLKQKKSDIATAFSNLLPKPAAESTPASTALATTSGDDKTAAQPKAEQASTSSASTSSTAPTLEAMQAQLGSSAPPTGALFESRCKAAYWMQQATSFGLLVSPDLSSALTQANDLTKSAGPKLKSALSNINKYWSLDFPTLPPLRL